MDVLARIDELRNKRGWSVNYLAMEAALTQSTLNNLYVRKAEPKLSTLRALCTAFGIPLSEFFAESEDNDKDTDEKEKKLTEELTKRIGQLPLAKKKALLELL